MPHSPLISRRGFHALTAGAIGAGLAGVSRAAENDASFHLNYMLPSCMYGYSKLEEILPEAKKIGATHIDVWPKVHGDQREQIEEMGEEKFAQLLQQNDVKLGCVTQYKLGPFGLQDEMRLAQRFGCQLMVTGGSGPKGLEGAELKKAVGDFLEKMKPHLEVAEETGVTIAIENHANNLIESPDSLRWLLELRPSKNLAIALAPYHLPQDEKFLAQLIHELADGLQMFYAWQHGDGAHDPIPTERQLLQMPGRGPLDFQPLIAALAAIQYQGWTEVFMHPVPRGVPILPTVSETTAEIVRGRNYLDHFVAQSAKGK
ncbi:sugar phosphate isomerase/epimerase [Blastopirellula sp. JC732]|uniref:Sugar phosphate isomerase/epimerase n=1 Tax=Blastopirellula sediminis TaxID=2894196 RepID=A0A9X1MNA1_9BACT|nr:TIM barrel protein [Blastopirellula sediminis]MCC9607382.1 sugar phosphate isomerase/epimerase [Blastopirellula sediminis]MCC9629325.1 sugar phosphate isomerase/epimerase [Blastopirellula sediminis]